MKSKIYKIKSNSNNIATLFNYNLFNFSLYIPKKRLEPINHPKYGLVIPIYLSNKNHSIYNYSIDNFYNKKIRKNYLYGLIIFSYCVIGYQTGFSYIVQKYLYTLLSNTLSANIFPQSELLFFLPCVLLWNIVKNYEINFNEKKNKVLSIYLDINGKDLIIEKIDEILLLDYRDIYFSSITSKWIDKNKKEKLNDSNINSLNIKLMYGRNQTLVINGPTTYLDYEIIQYCTNRYSIDTSQVTYNRETMKKVKSKNHNNNFDKSIINYVKNNYFFESINKTKSTNIYQFNKINNNKVL